VSSVNREQVLRSVGSAIASRRRDRGLSQEKLAELSGLHRTYIGAVERGIRNPTITSLTQLARGLACQPSDLLAEAGL
jgi:transcriptional regulator with XRE-family HTH domain